jgi:hypothetical protein
LASIDITVLLAIHIVRAASVGYRPNSKLVRGTGFALIRSRGEQHCPRLLKGHCRSDDVVYTTERTGQETLFCAACEYNWTRVPASDRNDASRLIATARRMWVGVERRLAMRVDAS